MTAGSARDDVRGHVVGRRELRERVRQVEQGAGGAGLAAGVVERGRGVERGGGEAGVRLQHDAFLREEDAVRVDRGEAAVAALGREHVDDDAVLVVVGVGGEELGREALRPASSSMPLRVDVLRRRRQRLEREHEDRRVHRVRGRAARSW